MLRPWTNDAGVINFNNLREVMKHLFGPKEIRDFVPARDIADPESELICAPYMLVGSKGSGKTLLLRCKEALLKQYEAQLKLVFASYATDSVGGRSTLLGARKIRIPLKKQSAYRGSDAWCSLFHFLIAALARIRLARVELYERFPANAIKDEFLRNHLTGSPETKALVGKVWDLYPEGSKGDFLSQIIENLVGSQGDFRSLATAASEINISALPGESRFVILIDSIDEAFCDDQDRPLVEHVGNPPGGNGAAPAAPSADDGGEKAGKVAAEAVEVWSAIQCGLADALLRLWNGSGGRIVAYATARGEIESRIKAKAQLKEFVLNLRYTSDELEAVFEANIDLWMAQRSLGVADSREARLAAFFGDGEIIGREKAIDRVLRHSLPYPRCVVEIGRQISELALVRRAAEVRTAIEKGAKILCEDHLKYSVPSFLPGLDDSSHDIALRRTALLKKLFRCNVIYRSRPLLSEFGTDDQSNPFGIGEDEFEILIRLRQLGLIGVPTPDNGSHILDFYGDLFDGGRPFKQAENVETVRDRLLGATYLVAHSSLAAFLDAEQKRLGVDRRLKSGNLLPCPAQLFRPIAEIYAEGPSLLVKAEGREPVAMTNRFDRLAVSILICACIRSKEEVSISEVRQTNKQMEKLSLKYRLAYHLNDKNTVKGVSAALKEFDFGINKPRAVGKDLNDHTFSLSGVRAAQISLRRPFHLFYPYGNFEIDAEPA